MSIPLKHFKKGDENPSLPEDGLLRLFSMRFCPYSERAHLILDAKKIPHHKIFIDLNEKPDWYIKYSPLGKVPALQLTGVPEQPTLIESLVIAEYLDDQYGETKLYPKDPLKKAQDKILIERFGAVISSIYPVFVKEEAPAGALTDFANGLDIFEKELSSRGTPFFGGDKPGMVDYMIWPWCERSAMLKHLLPEKYELDKSRFGQLLKWRDLMVQDEAVKANLLTGEVHAEFMRTRRAGNPKFDLAF